MGPDPTKETLTMHRLTPWLYVLAFVLLLAIAGGIERAH